MIKQIESSRIAEAKNNPQVLADLFDEFWQPIFNFLLRKTSNVEKAKDLTQETFIRALQAFNKFEPENQYSFSTWLYRIACNESNKLFRFLKTKPQLPIDAENISFLRAELESAKVEFQESQAAYDIQILIKHLKPKYRDVIILHYMENETFDRISEILGINSNTVRTWHSRAIKELREIHANETK